MTKHQYYLFAVDGQFIAKFLGALLEDAISHAKSVCPQGDYNLIVLNENAELVDTKKLHI